MSYLYTDKTNIIVPNIANSFVWDSLCLSTTILAKINGKNCIPKIAGNPLDKYQCHGWEPYDDPTSSMKLNFMKLYVVKTNEPCAKLSTKIETPSVVSLKHID